MDAGISSDIGEKPIKVRLFKSAELAPVVDLAGVDLHYLVGGDVLNGVLKVYDTAIPSSAIFISVRPASSSSCLSSREDIPISHVPSVTDVIPAPEPVC